MDFPSRSQFEIGDNRLSTAQKETADCYKLTKEGKESLSQEVLFEDVKDPDILFKENPADPCVQVAGDLQNLVKIEEEPDVAESCEQTLNAADLLGESASEGETFGYYQFPEEERKPFDKYSLFEDVKDSEALPGDDSTEFIAPTFEDLQNEVKIEEESADNGPLREGMLNAVDLLAPDEEETSENLNRSRSFACPFVSCPSSYKTFTELGEHMKIHSDEQNFFCDVCKKKFSSKDNAMEHIRQREKSECCGCGKIFSKYYFAEHLRHHTGEKPFICETCGKGFSSVQRLNNHMLTHTGKKPFSCSFCEKSFSQMGNLNVHERTHTGEKPLKCSHCDYRCGGPSCLAKHIQTRHTKKKKPFSCDYCKKRFFQKSECKNHERVHTGEKPFECSHCGKRFSQRGNLKLHLRVHTGEKPYSCGECDAKFAHSISLQNHMKKNHK